MTAFRGLTIGIHELYWVVLGGNAPMLRTSAFC